MSKNIQEFPFTEMVERISSLGRLGENTAPKVRGTIQDVYIREITNKWDWNFLLSSSSITTDPEHKLGTITISTGNSAATFSSDAALTAAMTGRKIKIDGNPVVYDFTYVSTSDGTLNPPFYGPSDVSGGSYSIFQPKYALAGDFDRFPKNGGAYKWSGGRKEILGESYFQDYVEDYQSSTTSDPEFVRLVDVNTAGQQTMELIPAPKFARVVGYDYVRKVRPLIELTDGTVTISASGQDITGTNTTFTNATTGDWLRVDALGTADDSSWYRIILITNDTTCKIATAFANSSVTAANYTISRAPEMPVKLHTAVFYGSLRTLMAEQNDEMAGVYNMKMAEVMSDAKALFVSRQYAKKLDTIAEDYEYRR